MSYNSALTTSDIWRSLRKHPRTAAILSGVVGADELMSLYVKRPALVVANTDPSWLPGRHWTAFYIPSTVRQLPEFFDSLGRQPGYYSQSFVDFLARFGDQYIHNTTRLQIDPNICGSYVLYFACHRAAGEQFVHIVNELNDNVVESFVNAYYSL